MALGVFRPGEYASLYDGLSPGMCTSGGKNLQWRRKGRPINDTDTYGLTHIDCINMGYECYLRCTFKEWNATIRKIIWPYGAAGAWDGTLNKIGHLDSDNAKVLVLTAKALTPAAVVGNPTTLTAEKAIAAEENDITMIFGPDETDMPVVFRLLPYDAGGGVIRFFSFT